MNLISSHSSVWSSKIKWVFKLFLFTISAVLIFTTTVSAAEYNINYFYDSTYAVSEPGDKKTISYSDKFLGTQLEIINTDPAIFQMGRHYTFDAVFQVSFGATELYSSTYTDAINSLISNGYTDEWYAHYIYGYEFVYYDSNNYEVPMSSTSYYVDPSECVVYVGNTCYTQFDDLLDSSFSGLGSALTIQIKVHFDFDVNSDISSLLFDWNVYQFSTSDDYRGFVRINTMFDVSNVISYDISTVGAMNTISIDIKSQIAGMESALVSSLDQLMAQQDRYWELLLGGYELSNFDFGMGILYEIVNYQDMTYSEIIKIYSKVNTINTNVTNIKATSQAMLKLLNGTDSTLFNFLTSHVTTLHNDLVDIKNYLDQSDKSSSVGSDVGGLSDELLQGVGQPDMNADVLPSITPDSGYNWFSETIISFQFILPFVLLGAFGVFIRMVVGR